jgi:hypothetical protein
MPGNRAEDAGDREAAEPGRGAADEDAAHFGWDAEPLQAEPKRPPLHRLRRHQQTKRRGHEQRVGDKDEPHRAGDRRHGAGS